MVIGRVEGLRPSLSQTVSLDKTTTLQNDPTTKRPPFQAEDFPNEVEKTFG